MNPKYALGIDYGTLSARSVLVDMQTGAEKASFVYTYPNGVIDSKLPGTEISLDQGFALQDPNDYREALHYLLKHTWEAAEIPPEQIACIGVDFTACTVLPVDEQMMPLCCDPTCRNDPHSWVKLWKHHGASAQNARIEAVAQERGETFLSRYGNYTSSEYYLPKLLETYCKSPEVFNKTHQFVHAGDWVTYLMTGNMATSYCTAGFKSFWNPKDGYPSHAFLEALAPGFGKVLEKMNHTILPNCSPCGTLTVEMAEKSGLSAGIPVAVSIVDAHSALPAVGAKDSGSLLMSMGTSLCHILVNQNEFLVPGINGVVEGGVLPNLYGYEAGQAAVGDIFDWFVSNLAGSDLEEEAHRNNESIFSCITRRAQTLAPGESGLVALDWWNGNRSILNNFDLTGLILGMTLSTKPEEIYRALVEATAFGTKTILENFENNGMPVAQVYACGGLAMKSPLVMQIYADVLGREIKISNITQTTAYGAAMYGMVALGSELGGYDTMEDAIDHLIQPPRKSYHPIPDHQETYNRLFAIYHSLHNYFGQLHPEIMSTLRKISASQSQ